MSELSPLPGASVCPIHVCCSVIEGPYTVSQYVPGPSTIFGSEIRLTSLSGFVAGVRALLMERGSDVRSTKTLAFLTLC